MTTFNDKKDQELFHAILLDLESRFDVNALRIGAVHVWPLVRLIMGRAFKSSDPIVDAGLAATSPGEAGLAERNQPIEFPRNKMERANLRLSWKKRVPTDGAELAALVERQWTTCEVLKGTEFVMLSKVEKYYEVRDGLRYAPIIDPVFEDLSARRRTAVLGLEPIPFACVHEPHRIDIEPFLKLHPQGELTVPRSTRQGLSEIHRYVQSAYPAYDFNQEDVFRRYRRLKHRERFFRRTFELIRPRIVFMSSFTGWLHAVLAARSLGIPVVDIQHGGQGPSHYPTTHYSRIPSTGYALLPDVFWLWGEMNLSYASPWLPGGADRHIPVVGGNRKVAHWYRRRERGELAEIDRRFIERFSSRAAVLITLSYGVDRLLPESLVEAIRTIPDVDWLVRLHPIHRTPQTVHQVKEHFADLGCSNVFVDEPTDVQLATALSVSFAHISPFSTSGTEATAMGVPTLICHPIGAKLFGAEIASGVLSYADDVDGIAAWVRRCREGASVDEVARRYYVETNDAAVDDIIRVAEAIPAATSDRQMPMTERILNLLGVRAR